MFIAFESESEESSNRKSSLLVLSVNFDYSGRFCDANGYDDEAVSSGELSSSKVPWEIAIAAKIAADMLKEEKRMRMIRTTTTKTTIV